MSEVDYTHLPDYFPAHPMLQPVVNMLAWYAHHSADATLRQDCKNALDDMRVAMDTIETDTLLEMSRQDAIIEGLQARNKRLQRAINRLQQRADAASDTAFNDGLAYQQRWIDD